MDIVGWETGVWKALHSAVVTTRESRICNLIGHTWMSILCHTFQNDKRPFPSGSQLIHFVSGGCQGVQGPLACVGETQLSCHVEIFDAMWSCELHLQVHVSSVTSGKKAAGVPGVGEVTVGLQFNMTSSGKFGSLSCTRVGKNLC